MAARHTGFEDIVEFATTQGSRSLVCLAAVSFAVFHGIAVASSAAAGDLGSDIEWQIIHLGAVLCRFVLPFGLMAFSLVSHVRSKRAGRASHR